MLLLFWSYVKLNGNCFQLNSFLKGYCEQKKWKFNLQDLLLWDNKDCGVRNIYYAAYLYQNTIMNQFFSPFKFFWNYIQKNWWLTRIGEDVEMLNQKLWSPPHARNLSIMKYWSQKYDWSSKILEWKSSFNAYQSWYESDSFLLDLHSYLGNHLDPNVSIWDYSCIHEFMMAQPKYGNIIKLFFGWDFYANLDKEY